ncbi:Uncharacterised protein [Mycobacterium tuberculosis]|uniref:Uncharacterized protein n=1 Tax=Mycobacterium tuberculosis TaxID=1773 RepID=A0A655IJP9_MYCTX|nr:Uncharacterised protein [Mycobacterium tuberculosis]CKQ56921.1 Uncharacterised protein [Mycobacterium tuberculosis]CKS90540.1 Uncharacterised protein [Mycobacterium tuberculosis]CNT90545.1 Uncharacterised protein [Mycobacterium tuberculosis]CNU11921.1 Uncharacterised protein [Mycobacterium tuberculosis]
MHLRALLSDRHGEHGMRKIIVKKAARQCFRACWCSPLAHSDSDHTRGEQQHVATLDRSGARFIGTPHTGEPRVMSIDEVGQRRFAHPCP